MFWGLEQAQPGVAAEASQEAFKRHLLIETAGSRDQVLKFLPPLIIEEELLREGLDIIDQSLGALVERRKQVNVGVSAEPSPIRIAS